MQEFGCKQEDSTAIHAVGWGIQGIRHVKHVSIHRKYVKMHVELETIRIVYCPTTEMTADILTKPLQSIVFEKNRLGLRVESTPTVQADRIVRRGVDTGAKRT